MRWPNGVACPRCGYQRLSWISTRHLHECVACGYQFSETTGTIFHKTYLPLRKWFLAIYLLTTHKKGISAKQLAKDLQLTYKTAWYMATRIRRVLKTEYGRRLQGIVEVDETYIGRARRHPGTNYGLSGTGQAIVMGMRERKGKVVLQPIANTGKWSLLQPIQRHIEPGTDIFTDDFGGYYQLPRFNYPHQTVCHSRRQWADGEVSTNGIENVWSHLKRTLLGIYHSVSSKYLPYYLDEFSFRFNYRHEVDLFSLALQRCEARGLGSI